MDKRAEQVVELGFVHDDSIGILEFDNWWAKVYRKDGKVFSVLELIERRNGYTGFLPPQADGLMKSTRDTSG